MLEKIIGCLMRGIRADEPIPVPVHDYMDRFPGHDIAVSYFPESDTGSAVVSSSSEIHVGDFLQADFGGQCSDLLFVVMSVQSLSENVYLLTLIAAEVPHDNN